MMRALMTTQFCCTITHTMHSGLSINTNHVLIIAHLFYIEFAIAFFHHGFDQYKFYFLTALC